jgi:hypothetical protein
MKRKILLLFFAGFLFRLLLSSFSDSNLVWDAWMYDFWAKKIIAMTFFAECCLKNMGYPAFLASIYSVFGVGNISAVRLIQSLLDTATGFLIFSTAGKILNTRAALFSLIIYLFNPLTASYTGILLPETVSLFYMAFTGFIITRNNFVKRRVLWFFLGLLLGLILFTKVQYYYFVLLFLFIYTVVYIRGFSKIIFLTVSVSGFLLASSYSLFTNYNSFHVISLKPPYGGIYGEGLYSGFYNDKRYPEINIDTAKINPVLMDIRNESLTLKPEDRGKFDEKYRKLFWNKFRTDWKVYIANTFRNMFWIWDKDHLFIYKDIFYPWDKYMVRIYNIILLVLFLLGLGWELIKKKLKAIYNPVFLYTFLIFIYITFFVTIISNESRHSVAVYSMIILWSGYGLERLIYKLKGSGK